MNKIKMNDAFRIALFYVIFALLWIFLSDKLISTLTNSLEVLTFYSSVKGFLFVTVTGILLYLLVRKRINEKNRIIRDLDREVEIREQLIRELHHRIKNNMQVVLSLINLEAVDSSGLTEVHDRISNKLLSMMSIFNIVYNLKDMKNISLNMVIEEYVGISIRNLIFVKNDVELKYSIELITSLMLVIDSVIEAYCSNVPSMGKIKIKLSGLNKIELRFPVLKEDTEIRKEDLDFIHIQLTAITGVLEIDEKSDKLYISFKDDL